MAKLIGVVGAVVHEDPARRKPTETGLLLDGAEERCGPRRDDAADSDKALVRWNLEVAVQKLNGDIGADFVLEEQLAQLRLRLQERLDVQGFKVLGSVSWRLQAMENFGVVRSDELLESKFSVRSNGIEVMLDGHWKSWKWEANQLSEEKGRSYHGACSAEVGIVEA